MDIQPFCIDKLMEETRKLACLYRQATGQTLPISNELGRFDAQRLLYLTNDFVFQEGPYKDKNVQIKSRVIFNENKNSYRIGQFKFEGLWDEMALLLYNAHYQPTDIYLCSRRVLSQSLKESKFNQKGMLSIAKFKAISRLIWTQERGIEWDEIWNNQA